jgi:IPT/TIG domain
MSKLIASERRREWTGRRSTALLAGVAALLGLAGKGAAAPATFVVSGLTSTAPGGFVFDGTNLWVTDAQLGFCLLGSPPALAIKASNCVKPTPSAILGQPAYDPATKFAYVPDTTAGGGGIYRYTLGTSSINSVSTSQLNIAPSLGAQGPGAIALGSDGNLYVSNTANGSVVRVTPATGAVGAMTTTLSGKAARGLAMVGSQLWIADTDGILLVAGAVGCGNKCRPTLDTPLGIVGPVSIVKDNVFVYIGTPSGVFRHNPNTGVTDLYSNSSGIGATAVLFSDVAAVGTDNFGNLYLANDPSAGQDTGAATIYTLPAGSAPGGQGPIPSVPPTVPPKFIPGAISNPAASFFSGTVSAPTGGIFMGTHLWVVDSTLGFCKVAPELKPPALTGCAVLPAGVVPGPPAFNPKGSAVYIPDTTGAFGILKMVFNPKSETLSNVTNFVGNSALTGAALKSTAPTALTFGPDGQVYAAMAGSPNILRITLAPNGAPTKVRSIGLMNFPGTLGLAFHGTDLYDFEKTDASVIQNATLCLGTCTPLFVGVVFTLPSGIAADNNYVYIAEAAHVWRYDPAAATYSILADTGLLKGVSTPFSSIGSITMDTKGNVYAAETNQVWQISSGPQLLSVTPASAAPGAIVPVDITGSGLTGATLNMPAGITASSTVILDSTHITSTFTVGAAVPLETLLFNVTTPAGTSNNLSFSIDPSAPSISSITPNKGVQGDPSDTITIAGTNLTGVLLNTSPGITATVLSNTGTAITATFAIAANAQSGPGGVSVSTASSPPVTSGVLTFTINPPPPTLASITPPSASQGANPLAVTIAGANLTNGTMTVPAGITATGVAITATQITATFAIAATAPLGRANITVTTAGGTLLIPFTINPPPPHLITMSPSTGPEAGSVAVTLTGTNLTGSVLNGNLQAGITTTNVTIVGDTQINATFNIDLKATLGPQPIIVTTAAGASNALNFNVTLPPPPTLTTLSATSGVQGVSVPVTLTGTNFAGATVNAGPGITVANLTQISATQLTANFVIGTTAAVGPQNVTITTPGGTSTPALVFTIISASAPALSAISPNAGTQGAVVTVTLTGTNLAGASAIGAGPGITATLLTVTATQVTANFTIASNAVPASPGITITTAGGTSQINPLVTFTISVPPPPTLTSITPASGFRGASVPVTLTGTNLTAASAINAGTGITVSNRTVVSSTQVTATFTIAAGATIGNQNVTITTPGGTSAPAVFAIGAPPPPTVTGINPPAGTQGSSVPVTLTGTNLIASVIGAPAGITVSNPVIVNATTVTATFVIAAGAPTGPQTLTITTPGGSVPVTFTIIQAPPTLTNIAPPSGVQGASVPVVLTGTNLTGSIMNLPAGITVAAPVVVNANATTVTATFVIGAGATLGSQGVTITTPGGITGPVAFTVTPPVPTLTSITPNAGAAGTTVSVTLNGTNLSGGTLTILGAAGVTASNVVATPTQITATLTITSGAAQGARTVTVTTPVGGTSNTQTFTVLPPAPTILLLSSATAKHGATAGITVFGTNLASLAANPVTVLLNGVPADSSVVTITNVQSVSQLQMKFNWTFANTAPLSAAGNVYTVTVTTLSGTSNAASFTVN